MPHATTNPNAQPYYGGFALVIVLFIILVIIGACMTPGHGGGYC